MIQRHGGLILALVLPCAASSSTVICYPSSLVRLAQPSRSFPPPTIDPDLGVLERACGKYEIDDVYGNIDGLWLLDNSYYIMITTGATLSRRLYFICHALDEN